MNAPSYHWGGLKNFTDSLMNVTNLSNVSNVSNLSNLKDFNSNKKGFVLIK